MIRIVEVMGFPESGKSTTLTHISKAVRHSLPETEVFVHPEFGNQAYLRSDFRHIGQEICVEAESYLLDMLKFEAFLEVFNKALDTSLKAASRKDANAKALLVAERGPNDVLFWELARGILDEDKKEVPSYRRANFGGLIGIDWERYRYTSKFERALVLTYGLGFSLFVDAVIFFTVSLKTAMNRREETGLSRQSHFVSPRNWKFLEQSARQLTPCLEHCYGECFLLIDGEKDIASNNQRVNEFVIRLLRNEKPTDNKR